MATTCKKCFAPLASTERICHSCGTPVDMTESNTWGGNDPLPKNPFVTRTRRPVQPTIIATPSVSMPATQSTQPDMAKSEPTANPEKPTEESQAVSASTTDTDSANTNSADAKDLIPDAPAPDLPSDGDSMLPLPPASGNTVSPTKNLSVSLDSVPSAKPDKKSIKQKKLKEPKNPNKKDNLPLYALIITALIAIGLAIALIFVLFIDNNSTTNQQNGTVTQVVSEPYPARVGLFSVDVPEGIFYTSNGDEAIFYDDTQTWSIYAKAIDFGMADIESKSNQIVENFRAAGYQAAEPEKQTIDDVDFLTIEVTNGDSAMVVAYTAIDDAHAFAISAVTASRVSDYTILENITEIFQTAKLAGNSPVSADDTGINRVFVSDFTPYVPPEATPETPPEEVPAESAEQPAAEQPAEPVPEVPVEPLAY